MEKYFNKLAEFNVLWVRLHLHKNKEHLGSLQPLGWRSLPQELVAPTP